MAKIIAHYSKKASGSQQYSSNQYSASIEVETDSDDPESLKAYLRRCFILAKESVEEQMQSASARNVQPVNGNATTGPRPHGNGYRNGVQNAGHANGKPSNGNGRHVPATQAQVKAVYAICKGLGIDSAQYNAESMTVSQASKLIDELKSQQAANQ